jgi:hypothetical protein
VPRYFTPEEANAALEQVRPLAERMVAVRAQLRDEQRRQAELATLVAGNGHGNSAREYAQLTASLERGAQELVRCAREIQELGALVKDLEQGLVDFPWLREGEEVLLCWRVGEDAVAFWHPVDEGFAGRRPL